MGTAQRKEELRRGKWTVEEENYANKYIVVLVVAIIKIIVTVVVLVVVV